MLRLDGQAIAARRQAARLTQERLAELAGYGSGTRISEIERGDRGAGRTDGQGGLEVAPFRVLALADALEVQPATILVDPTDADLERVQVVADTIARTGAAVRAAEKVAQAEAVA